MKRINMDHAATTYLDPEVLEVMMPWFTEHYGNASSVYAEGRDARAAVEHAREQVQAALGAKDAREIYFTSGGTESDNWAVKGYAFANQRKGKHIITSNVEHHALLHTCAFLEKMGFEVTYLPVDHEGRISAEQVRNAIREDTILVSILFANNEIGSINPIAEIGAVCREKKVAFHTDAVQAAGAVPIDVEAMNIDMLSLSAHKFNGPKGVGVLYVRKGIRLENLLHGGAQEHGHRGSTYNTPGIVGLGEALDRAVKALPEKTEKLTALRDHLKARLTGEIEHVIVNGSWEHRLPNNLNVCFRFIEGESLLLNLDLLGISASSGSACTSGSLDPSHVLLAIGLPHEVAHGSLRLTLGAESTLEDVDRVADVLPGIVKKLRDMSPLYADFIANN